jgi:hypothetical protein
MNGKIFYIPTSTLNFNNILSSESISPKAFYEERGFGYKRWELIPKNNYKNAITLYDKECFFCRQKSDIEDHPLLIEVQLPKDDKNLESIGEGVFLYKQTIYLDPFTTKFIFFSEEDRKITLSMSESSSETKTVELYKSNCEVHSSSSEIYKQIEYTKEETELNIDNVRRDIRINKIKGALYGYYIGALLSTDKDSVQKLNILMKIRDIFASIRSDENKCPTHGQQIELDDLFNAFYEKITQPYESKFKSLVERSLKDIVINNKDIELGNLFKEIRLKMLNKNQLLYELRLDNKQKEKDEGNSAMVQIEEEIKKQKRYIWDNRKYLHPDDSEIIFIDGKLDKISVIEDDKEKTLFKSMANEILMNKEYNGDINIFKKTLADEITRKAKEICVQEWENSLLRDHLNKLRHMIADEDVGFNWSNNLTSSLAAVLLKGDDWQKLLRFMQSKEMTDYKLAFAIYGELNGFANLTRDFTDILLNQKQYVEEVYREFYGQLFNRYLPKDKNIKLDNRIEEQVIKEERQVLECLKPLFENDSFEKIKHKGFGDYYIGETLKIYKKYPHVDDELLKRLKKVEKPKKTNGDWNGCCRELKKSLSKKNKTSKKENNQPELFGQQQHIVYDIDNVNRLIDEVLTKNTYKDYIKKVKQDYDWLLNEYSKLEEGQRSYSYYYKDKYNNEVIIEKLFNLRKDKTEYPEQIRDLLKTELIKIYCKHD